jgi:hypothetical protein
MEVNPITLSVPASGVKDSEKASILGHQTNQHTTKRKIDEMLLISFDALDIASAFRENENKYLFESQFGARPYSVNFQW